MIKMQHSPAFKVIPIPLKWCPICQGKAVSSRGHELPCAECHVFGWVSAKTGEPLPVDILETQFNRRGPGATNFTGD
ncbi:hypothetical protein M2392_002589 [Pseudomonas grimontii]|nr:hypothetical protein [Pseudomonas grimontii]